MQTTVNLEDKITDYIRGLSVDNNEVSLSLAKMAENIGCSVASVHRTVKKLEENGLIQVKRSKARNKPDVINFVGEPDDIIPVVSEILAQSNSVNSLIQSLAKKLSDKQNENLLLKDKLKTYENRYILTQVQITKDISAIFFMTE